MRRFSRRARCPPRLPRSSRSSSPSGRARSSSRNTRAHALRKRWRMTSSPWHAEHDGHVSVEEVHRRIADAARLRVDSRHHRLSVSRIPEAACRRSFCVRRRRRGVSELPRSRGACFACTTRASLSAARAEHGPLDVRYVVVLGSSYEPHDSVPVTAALDYVGLTRIVEGVRLAKRLDAARLVVSGGGRTGSAIGYAELAHDLGVSSDAIVVNDTPLDTGEEAKQSAQLVGAEPFLLVTSANHMPRAVRLLERAGAHPIPAPTDQRANSSARLGWAESITRCRWVTRYANRAARVFRPRGALVRHRLTRQRVWSTSSVEMARVLVTGATGFIGRHLCAIAPAAGHVVRAAVRGTAAALAGVPEHVVVGDVGRSTEWRPALAGVDTVIHLAARVHVLHDTDDGVDALRGDERARYAMPREGRGGKRSEALHLLEQREGERRGDERSSLRRR